MTHHPPLIPLLYLAALAALGLLSALAPERAGERLFGAVEAAL